MTIKKNAKSKAVSESAPFLLSDFCLLFRDADLSERVSVIECDFL